MKTLLKALREKLCSLTARTPDQTEVWFRELEQLEADNPEWARECRVREARVALQSGLSMEILLCAFSKDVLEEAGKPPKAPPDGLRKSGIANVENGKPSLD